MLVEREVRASPAAVARVMFEPENDPRWIGGARAIQRLTPGDIGLGSRVRRDGGFLGRKFHWVTEVEALEMERLLSMRFVEGPMKGMVRYHIRPSPAGAVVGVENSGSASFAVPGVAWMLRRSVTADLKRLAVIVENEG
ncbi:MAG: SRPBCC family protein [Sphingomonadales bacterium]